MLEKDEKRAFLKLMAFLSLIDGKVTEEEVVYLAEAATIMGLSPIGIFEEASDKNLGELCEELHSNKSRKIALFELINIANIDGRYDDVEKRGISNIGELLNLSKYEIKELEQLSKEGLKWMKKSKKALGIKE